MVKSAFLMGLVSVIWTISPIIDGVDLTIEFLPLYSVSESEIEKIPAYSLTEDISKTDPPNIDPIIQYPSGG